MTVSRMLDLGVAGRMMTCLMTRDNGSPPRAGQQRSSGKLRPLAVLAVVALEWSCGHWLLASVPQRPANWGLQRIIQPQLPLSHKSRDVADGAGVHIYVIGT